MELIKVTSQNFMPMSIAKEKNTSSVSVGTYKYAKIWFVKKRNINQTNVKLQPHVAAIIFEY